MAIGHFIGPPVSGGQATDQITDNQCHQRRGNRLFLHHIADLAHSALSLAGRLIIGTLCLSFRVAGHVPNCGLHPPAEITSRTFNLVVHLDLHSFGEPQQRLVTTKGSKARSRMLDCENRDRVKTMQITDLDPDELAHDIATDGYATRAILPAETCRALAALYDDDARFRKRIVMEHRAYGQGEYKYFAYPLPDVIGDLRTALYPAFAAVANAWRQALGESASFPPTLAEWLNRCHAAGQTRPTPLLLRYDAGGFNCLHQDLYGDLVFPIQAAILLDAPGDDFTGGEFMLVEQRPRAQSRGLVVPLRQGQAVIFPVHHRPAKGTRSAYRLTVRHGVSRVHSGRRHTLGIIFHDAA